MSANRRIVMLDDKKHVIEYFKSARAAAAATGMSLNAVQARLQCIITKQNDLILNKVTGQMVTFRYEDSDDIADGRTDSHKDYVMDHLSDRMLMVLIMEECSELIQACAKRLRVADPEGFTPVTPQKALAMFNEEADDLLMLFEIAGVIPEGTTDTNPKWDRWYKRMKEA